MTREEMLQKLKNIKPTAFPTTATMDMGLEFDVMDSNGVYTYLGSIGDWPLWYFERIEEKTLSAIKNKLDNHQELSSEDFKETDLYNFAKRLENREDFEFTEAFKNIVNFPKSEENKYVYVYCDLGEWVPELDFYSTEEEISNVFFGYYSTNNKWEDLDDDWLSTYYEELEEHEEGLPFNTSEDIIDDED